MVDSSLLPSPLTRKAPLARLGGVPGVHRRREGLTRAASAEQSRAEAQPFGLYRGNGIARPGHSGSDASWRRVDTSDVRCARERLLPSVRGRGRRCCWRGDLVQREPLLELPSAILALERVLIAARQIDPWAACGGDEGPSRGGGGRVAGDVDLEVRHDVIRAAPANSGLPAATRRGACGWSVAPGCGIAPIATAAARHQLVDALRPALRRTHPARPLTVSGEQLGVGLEVAGVERPFVSDQQVLDFLLVLEILDTCGERVERQLRFLLLALLLLCVGDDGRYRDTGQQHQRRGRDRAIVECEQLLHRTLLV